MSIYRRQFPIIRANQGDIYRKLSVPFSTIPVQGGSGEEIEITEIDYPYAVVLSQECDLEQDYTNRCNANEEHDKFLPSILFAPAYLSEKLRYGKHLEEIGMKMQHISSIPWKVVKQNKNYRYHFLDQGLTLGVPELTIDFKHYFTVPRGLFCYQFLNEHHYVASLETLFRETLSIRFGYYLSRIGLPVIKKDINEAGNYSA